MPYQKKVVLHCPAGYQLALDQLIEYFLNDGVNIVCVAGKDHAKVEDIIDELVVGDGSDPHRFINTTSHDTLAEAVEFAESWTLESPGKVEVVEL